MFSGWQVTDLLAKTILPQKGGSVTFDQSQFLNYLAFFLSFLMNKDLQSCEGLFYLDTGNA